MEDSEPGPRVGSRFGPYQLTRLLGRGVLGAVYAAEDTRDHRMLALKLFSGQFSGSPVFRLRMRREADAAGRLIEPHIVRIEDCGGIDGRVYLAMPLIDGPDLAALLRRSGPLSPARAVAIVRQVASALDAAHDAGVVHRDVKPQNILVTDDDVAYLADFGVARAAADPGLTQAGDALGNYNYMAPERFTGADVTPLVDVYSLACVLAKCLTGLPPYRIDSIEEAVDAHLSAQPPRVSALAPGPVPAAFDDVVARGMAKNPEDRYRSPGQLAVAAYEALTEAERNQVTRILARGAAGIGAAAAACHGSEAGPVLPPAADEGSWQRAPLTPAPAPLPAAVPGRAGPLSGGSSPYPSAPSRRVPHPMPRPMPRPKRGRKPVLLGAAAVAAVVVAAGAVHLVGAASHGSSVTAAAESVVPVDGIDFRLSPGGVALDAAGNIYATSQGMSGRVVKLSPGSNAATLLPFTGLHHPEALAVDGSGAVYVADRGNDRVVKLARGSNEQVVLPFVDLDHPEGVAVDAGGNVYVADRDNDRVVELEAMTSNQLVLPFAGLGRPGGVAVDGAGSVYVIDGGNNRVLKLPAASTEQVVLPFNGIARPFGIAVDGADNVYVTEHDRNKVAKWAAGSIEPSILPFTDLNTPSAVVADKDGNVIVADRGNDRLVKLAAGR